MSRSAVQLERELQLATSFLALKVIPALKVTGKGLGDVNRFEFAPLRVD